MAVQLDIDQISINAPASWGGSADTFRNLLETALSAELHAAIAAGEIHAREVVRIDTPPITVQDVYELDAVAREIARRIVQAIRQSSPE